MPQEQEKERKSEPGADKPHPDEPRSFKAGEEGGYRTDTFSRGDREGAPSPEEAAGDDGGGTSSVEATPDAGPLKATDDPDARDAPPPPAQGGGVR